MVIYQHSLYFEFSTMRQKRNRISCFYNKIGSVHPSAYLIPFSVRYFGVDICRANITMAQAVFDFFFGKTGIEHRHSYRVTQCVSGPFVIW